ncbi:MAG: hypothetical protein QOD42_3663 [Sphingomonadales bacterium]|jgi:hypothetical protein|nr:hypothetical protein [Sphingomonadales bacterium]
MTRLIIALAIASVPAALTATPLVREATLGAERHCFYAPPGNLRTTVTRRGQQEQRMVRIGLGEPCPQTYPVQRVQRARPARAQIPTMATLAASEVRGTQRICVYTYLGQSYRRAVAQNRTCPLTPHFQ